MKVKQYTVEITVACRIHGTLTQQRSVIDLLDYKCKMTDSAESSTTLQEEHKYLRYMPVSVIVSTMHFTSVPRNSKTFRHQLHTKYMPNIEKWFIHAVAVYFVFSLNRTVTRKFLNVSSITSFWECRMLESESVEWERCMKKHFTFTLTILSPSTQFPFISFMEYLFLMNVYFLNMQICIRFSLSNKISLKKLF